MVGIRQLGALGVGLAVFLLASSALAEPRYNHAGKFSLGGRAAWYGSGAGTDGLHRGVGAMMRYQISRRFAAEGSVGFFEPTDPGNCDCVLEMQTIPIDLSAVGFIFPDWPFSVYGLLGAHYELTSVEVKEDPDDDNFYDTRSYQRWGTQAGIGAEISLGARFAVTADWRYIFNFTGPLPDPVGQALARYGTVHFTVGLNYFF